MTRLSALIAATLAISLVSGTAFADSRDRNSKGQIVQEQSTRERTVKKVVVQKQETRGQNKKVVIVQKSAPKVQKQSSNSHRSKVGHRFSRNEVVVIQDWDRRGLRSPRQGEVYAAKGDVIYLLAASSLIVKALMN
ncbi:hypothetical protein OO012_00015 [Rhodobacteraceae bacterium KMM 6894]|nr:hypothetical protein [Rhodobacteraceae bacterium KMM 6894]